MRAYIGITDYDWYELLASRIGLDEVNFWQPGASRQFRTLEPGEMFLFKLHSPLDAIVGGGPVGSEALLAASGNDRASVACMGDTRMGNDPEAFLMVFRDKLASVAVFEDVRMVRRSTTEIYVVEGCCSDVGSHPELAQGKPQATRERDEPLPAASVVFGR